MPNRTPEEQKDWEDEHKEDWRGGWEPLMPEDDNPDLIGDSEIIAQEKERQRKAEIDNAINARQETVIDYKVVSV